MSSGSGSRMKKGSGGSSSSIPSTMRETVLNVKEIVKKCTEQEIYAMLKECNMDPDETVHRLLNQDTFHEVKSKREKKKNKRTDESGSQGVGNSSSRGVRAGADHAGRSTAQTTSNGCEGTRAKNTHANDNGSGDGTSSVLGSVGTHAKSSCSWSIPRLSYNDDLRSTAHFPGLSDRVSLPPQTSTVQNNLFGVPGQPSMVDIVKMCRPQQKLSSTPLAVTEACNSSSRNADDPEIHTLQDNTFKVAEVGHEPNILVGQHESLEEWTLVDHPAQKNSLVHVDVSDPSVYHDPSVSSLLIDNPNPHLDPHSEDIQKLGHDGDEHVAESIVSYGQDDFSFLGDGSLRNSSSYQQREDEDVHEELSSATANLQHLSLQKEEQGASSAEENPAVIIPYHLQVDNGDCSHLSFGSFGLGVRESAPANDDSDARNLEYFNAQQLRTTSDDNVSPTTTTSYRNYDVVSTLEAELRRDETIISEQTRQFNNPSVSSFALSGNMPQSDAAYDHSHLQTNSYMDNLASVRSLTPHRDSAPSNFVAGNSHTLRDAEPAYLKFLANQHNLAVSSSSGSTISMHEALKSGLFSYPQPTLPSGNLANTFPYSVPPQSVNYMPFSGNSGFHQSPASLQSTGMKYSHSQFKSSMPLIPQSLSVEPDYRGVGSSTNIPGDFLRNSGMPVRYEEPLRSRYKGALHQSENASMLLHRSNSRPHPVVPASNFYGIQGQAQKGSSIPQLQQVQQPSQMMGYPNLHNTQLGGQISHEHQQLSRQANVNSAQSQSSQLSHFWKHGY